MPRLLRFSIACWLVPAASAAAPTAVSQLVEFRAPQECIQRDQLAALVAKNLQGVVVSERRRVDGQALATPNGFEFLLELRERETLIGERVLQVEGSDCHREDESLALVIAMLLEGPDEADGPPSAVPIPPTVATPPPPAPIDPSQPPAQADAGLPVAVGLSLSLSSQLQPSWSPGALVDVVADLPHRFSLRALGGYFATSAQTGSGGGSVEMSQWTAGLETCAAPTLAPVRLDVCAGARWIVLPATGRDFPRNAAATATLGAASLLARARWPLGSGPWRAVAAAGLLVPWNRARFVSTDTADATQVLHETGRAAPTFELGLEFQVN